MKPAKWIAPALIAALALSMLPRAAAAFSGAERLELCTTGRDAPAEAANRIFCNGYLEGYLKGLHSSYTLTTGIICIPDGVTPDQVRLVTVDFLRKHPTLLSIHAELLVVTALAEEFPCD